MQKIEDWFVKLLKEADFTSPNFCDIFVLLSVVSGQLESKNWLLRMAEFLVKGVT